MLTPSVEAVIEALLDSSRLSFAHMLRIPVENASAESLFRLASIALLVNEQMNGGALWRASELFVKRNWTSPYNLAKSTLEERVTALQEADYIMFDANERCAYSLGELAQAVIVKYNGDLRNLRKAAGKKPGEIRRALGEINGMGTRQVDVFLREAQVAWNEVFPFMTEAARGGARGLGLPGDPSELAMHCRSLEFPRLVSALEAAASAEERGRIIEKAQSLAPQR